MDTAYMNALKGLQNNVCPRRSVTAPNRPETRNWDLIAAIARCRDSGALEALRSQLREMTGRTHIFFAPSGRCAIAQVLSMLPQAEVVMPAFTCPVVKQAAELAQKRIIYVDIARDTLNATAEYYARAAKPGRILLPTHLFGIPADIIQICDLARARGCVTVEDAAGAFPARLEGRMLGTFADVGIISFERSKRLSAFRGAAIIVNNEKAVDLTRLSRHRVVPTATLMPIRELLFSVAYNLATIPWLYGRVTLPRRLRQYMLRSQAKRPAASPAAAGDDSYRREFHPYQAALLVRQLRRIEQVRTHIRQLASVYQKTFLHTSIETFVPPGYDTAGLLRFPIAFPGKNRSEILRAALSRGLFLETNYEQPLPREADQALFPNSLWAAQNVMLMPLYTALSAETATRLASQVVAIEQDSLCPQSVSLMRDVPIDAGAGPRRAHER